MANRITDDCIGCGNCEIACIHGAISALGEVYTIDPKRCDGCVSLPCGCRCMKVCPTEAIVRTPKLDVPFRTIGGVGVAIQG